MAECTIEQTEAGELLRYEADDGWACTLFRYYSEYLGETVTATTIYDDQGREALHAGTGTGELTEESAARQVEAARQLIPLLARRNKTR